RGVDVEQRPVLARSDVGQVGRRVALGDDGGGEAGGEEGLGHGPVDLVAAAADTLADRHAHVGGVGAVLPGQRGYDQRGQPLQRPAPAAVRGAGGAGDGVVEEHRVAVGGADDEQVRRVVADGGVG